MSVNPSLAVICDVRPLAISLSGNQLLQKDKPTQHDAPPSKPQKRFKSGAFERRLSLTNAGIMAGAKAARGVWKGAFSSAERRQALRQEQMQEQARYLVGEIAKLKGGMVKVGQVMALYGEQILPAVVIEELRKLEDKVTPLAWPVIDKQLTRELGPEKLAELEIDPEPIGAASLAQVHRARRLSDGAELCLKIQYPGVAASIDNDLDDLCRLLLWSKVFSLGADIDEWLQDIRETLHREVDYRHEARMLRDYAELLEDDSAYRVPSCYEEYCTATVLAMSYETGFVVNAPELASMSQAVRNRFAQLLLKLFFHELYDWQLMQSDPNFGNYLFRSGDGSGGKRIRPADACVVLLDFGSVAEFDKDMLYWVGQMIKGAIKDELDMVVEGARELGILQPGMPEEVQTQFARVCMLMAEPLLGGRYDWGQSDLPRRIAKQAARSALSKHFKAPPKAFTFMSRKLLGLFNLISALNADFDASEIVSAYVEK